MNHQGGMDHFNSDGNIQNEVNSHGSTGTLGLHSSSISRTGSGQRLPDRLSGSNGLSYHESANLVPSHDCSAGVFPRNIDLNAEYVGMEEQGMDGSSLEKRRLSCKRRTPELAFREFSAGESSSRAAQSGIPKRRAAPSQVHASNSLNISSPFTDPANGQPEQFQAAIGHGTMRQLSDMQYLTEARQTESFQRNIHLQNNFNRSAPYTAPAHNYPEQFDAGIGYGTASAVSDMQHLNEAGQTENSHGHIHLQNRVNTSALRTGAANYYPEQFEAGVGHGIVRPLSDMLHLSEPGQIESFQSNIHLQRATSPQDFVPPSILSMGYTRNPRVQLPGQPLSSYQYDHPFFYSSAGISAGAIPSRSRQIVHAPDFHETLQASRWIDIMRSRSVPLPPSFSHVYTGTGGGTAAPFHNPRNIMIGPQTGRASWVHNAANLSFANGTANYLGNLEHPSQYGSIPNSHLSNAPTQVPGFNLSEQYARMSSGTANHSVAATTGFPRQTIRSPIDFDPAAVSQEMDFPFGFNDVISQDQHSSEAISEDQVDGNPELHFTSQSPAQIRNRLVTEIRNTLEYLRREGALRLEELMFRNHPLRVYVLEHDDDDDDEDEDDDEDTPLVENMSYEALLALEEDVGDVDMGLSEEDILMHLRQETFQSIVEGTPENAESCCICQEDYVDGDELGKLDCGHKYHFSCIRQWLVQKNNCPICKQTALAVPDHDV